MRRHFFYSFLAILSVVLAGAMVIYPQATFQGAVYGLKTWAIVLVPALLPFFIISDVLMELGVVSFLGQLLEPLMRPLFKQPGESGFVLAMGFTSGFPMGAILTNTLFEKNILSKEEASRLLAFTNNSSPLFLLVAIPVGMFSNPNLGLILLLSHYAANLCLGLFLGIITRAKQPKRLNQSGNIFKRSLQELFRFQKNSKPLGTLLGSAINKSIQNMLMIGGFVIFFAVLIEIFKETSIFYILTLGFAKLLQMVNLTPNLSEALTTGLFEMTLGAQKATQFDAPLNHQLMIVSLILGWSGLSIQAQVTSIAARNNIPVSYYLFGRLFQGILALILTFLLFEPLAQLVPVGNFDIFYKEAPNLFSYYSFSVIASLIIVSVLLFLSIIFHIVTQIKSRLEA